MALPPTTRYVILEWPSVGVGPDTANSSVYASLYDAQDEATDLNAAAKRDGRPNTFTVHPVDMDVIA